MLIKKSVVLPNNVFDEGRDKPRDVTPPSGRSNVLNAFVCCDSCNGRTAPDPRLVTVIEVYIVDKGLTLRTRHPQRSPLPAPTIILVPLLQVSRRRSDCGGRHPMLGLILSRSDV
ncbi:hypothetical protein EVAR_14527_1 [Eumeta japonica]|uniref:Uncharacterized protein n=1 Tax=Eumeta variegata TaxID=151549 RepID=A0A4C1U3C4_EUMVA|nr:hypothetical protein EVAR_14527_1 [Eumeta japonica]